MRGRIWWGAYESTCLAYDLPHHLHIASASTLGLCLEVRCPSCSSQRRGLAQSTDLAALRPLRVVGRQAHDATVAAAALDLDVLLAVAHEIPQNPQPRPAPALGALGHLADAQLAQPGIPAHRFE